MIRYLARRFLSGLLTLYIFMTALFFTVQLALPGDYAAQQSIILSGPERQALRATLGLDQPLAVRYVQWLGRVLRGDLGSSYTLSGEGPAVVDILNRVVPSTLLVFGIGTALAFLLGYWLGTVTGWRGPGFLSGLATTGGILLYTSFPPWLGFLLTYGVTRVYAQARTWPSIDRRAWVSATLSESEIMWRMLLWIMAALAAALIIRSLVWRLARRRLPGWLLVLLAAGGALGLWALFDWFPFALDIMKRAAFPLVAFILLTFGEIMLIMRTNMVDTRHDEYITTARAKGLKPGVIRSRHAARNALLPSLSRMVISIPYLLAGMVMIEISLHWTGLGTTLYDAMRHENIPLWIGTALVIGAISLAARLIMDILVAALDPRVRHALANGDAL